VSCLSASLNFRGGVFESSSVDCACADPLEIRRDTTANDKDASAAVMNVQNLGKLVTSPYAGAKIRLPLELSSTHEIRSRFIANKLGRFAKFSVSILTGGVLAGIEVAPPAPERPIKQRSRSRYSGHLRLHSALERSEG
jgi:hypothetical protein